MSFFGAGRKGEAGFASRGAGSVSALIARLAKSDDDDDGARKLEARVAHLDFVAGLELGPDRDPGGTRDGPLGRGDAEAPACEDRSWEGRAGQSSGEKHVPYGQSRGRLSGARRPGPMARRGRGIRPSRAAGRMRTVEDGRCGGECGHFACESRTGRFRARRVVTTRLLSSTGHAPALAVCHIFGRLHHAGREEKGAH